MKKRNSYLAVGLVMTGILDGSDRSRLFLDAL